MNGMIPALILVVSVAFLAQFFVAYCRSLIYASFAQELSPNAHEVTGIEDHHVTGEDFKRLLSLVHLCPAAAPTSSGMQLAAVGAYYSAVSLLGSVTRPVSQGMAAWAERERKTCSYYAAVELDRRITENRSIASQHYDRF